MLAPSVMMANAGRRLMSTQHGRLVVSVFNFYITHIGSKETSCLLKCSESQYQVRSLAADPVSALASLAVEPMEIPDRKQLPEDAVVVIIVTSFIIIVHQQSLSHYNNCCPDLTIFKIICGFHHSQIRVSHCAVHWVDLLMMAGEQLHASVSSLEIY